MKLLTEKSLQHKKIQSEIERTIVGQKQMIERVIIALLAKGHILLEGLPGVAKTLTISTVAKCIGAQHVRFQFTPDLLPSDILGTRLWLHTQEKFAIEWGPIFTNIVLADEINRAPAKVQSALLEAMAEKQVSLAGATKPLPSPFLVLATQNPLESEGVYPLPKAQQDRFMMKVLVSYPNESEELDIVKRMSETPPAPQQIVNLDELKDLQQKVSLVHIDSPIEKYAVRLTIATREPASNNLPELEELIEHGVSPRATLDLLSAAKALAFIRGKDAVETQEIADLVTDIFRHRLHLSYVALAKEITSDDIVNRILAVYPPSEIML